MHRSAAAEAKPIWNGISKGLMESYGPWSLLRQHLIR